jgi:hypothetical protein
LTSLMERLDEEFSVTAIAQQKQSQQQSLFWFKCNTLLRIASEKSWTLFLHFWSHSNNAHSTTKTKHQDQWSILMLFCSSWAESKEVEHMNNLQKERNGLQSQSRHAYTAML